MFSSEFCKISKNTFFTEQLLATAWTQIEIEVKGSDTPEENTISFLTQAALFSVTFKNWKFP